MAEKSDNGQNTKYSIEGTEKIIDEVRNEQVKIRRAKIQSAIDAMQIDTTVDEFLVLCYNNYNPSRKKVNSLLKAIKIAAVLFLIIASTTSISEVGFSSALLVGFWASVYAAWVLYKADVNKKRLKDEAIKDVLKISSERELFEKEKEKFQSFRKQQTDSLQKRQEEIDKIAEKVKSNLSAIPYFAGIMADFETKHLDIMIQKLSWGDSKARMKKVASLVEIKRETKLQLQKSKEAEYQLAYAIQMFPALEDFIATDYAEAAETEISQLSSEHHDATRNYLSAEEYARLSNVERNQLALDRYRESHRKSNWQIGRDYENYVGYLYTVKGYSVEYFGSLKGIEDLGRDLIAKKDQMHLIVQCKFWSKQKQIHEKHINQLYGTMIEYAFENGIAPHHVCGVFVTNISLSETAKKFSEFLGIEVVENLDIGDYPCIKCNINKTTSEKIYHLPFDQQYDTTVIREPGEFFAMTVREAEEKGFRRAFRWHSQS